MISWELQLPQLFPPAFNGIKSAVSNNCNFLLLLFKITIFPDSKKDSLKEFFSLAFSWPESNSFLYIKFLRDNTWSRVTAVTFSKQLNFHNGFNNIWKVLLTRSLHSFSQRLGVFFSIKVISWLQCTVILGL